MSRVQHEYDWPHDRTVHWRALSSELRAGATTTEDPKELTCSGCIHMASLKSAGQPALQVIFPSYENLLAEAVRSYVNAGGDDKRRFTLTTLVDALRDYDARQAQQLEDKSAGLAAQVVGLLERLYPPRVLKVLAAVHSYRLARAAADVAREAHSRDPEYYGSTDDDAAARQFVEQRYEEAERELPAVRAVAVALAELDAAELELSSNAVEDDLDSKGVLEHLDALGLTLDPKKPCMNCGQLLGAHVMGRCPSRGT